MLSTSHRWTVACVCLTTWCVVGSGRAAEDDAVLRARALALNHVEGDDVIQRKVRALVADAAGTRKLLDKQDDSLFHKPKQTEPIRTEPKKTKPARASARTLWDRLGGEANVTKVVADFVAATVADPKVN